MEKKDIILNYLNTHGKPNPERCPKIVFAWSGANKDGAWTRYYDPITGKVKINTKEYDDYENYDTQSVRKEKEGIILKPNKNWHQPFVYFDYDLANDLLEISCINIDSSRPDKNLNIDKREFKFETRYFLFRNDPTPYNMKGEEDHPERMGKYYNKYFADFLKYFGQWSASYVYMTWNAKRTLRMFLYNTEQSVPGENINQYVLPEMYRNWMPRAVSKQTKDEQQKFKQVGHCAPTKDYSVVSYFKQGKFTIASTLIPIEVDKVNNEEYYLKFFIPSGEETNGYKKASNFFSQLPSDTKEVFRGVREREFLPYANMIYYNSKNGKTFMLEYNKTNDSYKKVRSMYDITNGRSSNIFIVEENEIEKIPVFGEIYALYKEDYNEIAYTLNKTIGVLRDNMAVDMIKEKLYYTAKSLSSNQKVSDELYKWNLTNQKDYKKDLYGHIGLTKKQMSLVEDVYAKNTKIDGWKTNILNLIGTTLGYKLAHTSHFNALDKKGITDEMVAKVCKTINTMFKNDQDWVYRTNIQSSTGWYRQPNINRFLTISRIYEYPELIAPFEDAVNRSFDPQMRQYKDICGEFQRWNLDLSKQEDRSKFINYMNSIN